MTGRGGRAKLHVHSGKQLDNSQTRHRGLEKQTGAKWRVETTLPPQVTIWGANVKNEFESGVGHETET